MTATDMKLTLTQASQAADDLMTLINFMPISQRQCIRDGLRGEEQTFFAEKLREYAQRVTDMPKTGEALKNLEAVVYLHYFRGSTDAWITEKDVGDGTSDERQHQAFGAVNLYGTGLRIATIEGQDYLSGDAELGYVSIAELIENGVELDLHWTPKTLKECAKG